MAVFTDEEIVALQENPDALRALANWHDCKCTEADAIEPGAGDFNDLRAEELRNEAYCIESEY